MKSLFDMQYETRRGMSALARWMLFACVWLGCTACAFCADAAKEPDPQSPETIARLEKGEIVIFRKGSKDSQGKSLGHGKAIVLINRPVSEVWDCLTHQESHPEFMPRLKSLERYSENGNEVGAKESVKIVFGTILYHVLLVRDKAAGTITWRLDKSKKNDIKDTNGNWMVKPYGENRCMLTYAVSVESGMYFPKAIENFFMNQDLPNVVKAVKLRVESGGTYKK